MPLQPYIGSRDRVDSRKGGEAVMAPPPFRYHCNTRSVGHLAARLPFPRIQFTVFKLHLHRFPFVGAAE